MFTIMSRNQRRWWQNFEKKTVRALAETVIFRIFFHPVPLLFLTHWRYPKEFSTAREWRSRAPTHPPPPRHDVNQKIPDQTRYGRTRARPQPLDRIGHWTLQKKCTLNLVTVIRPGKMFYPGNRVPRHFLFAKLCLSNLDTSKYQTKLRLPHYLIYL